MRLSVRLTLAMTALVSCTVAAIGLLAYYNIGRAVVPSELTRLAYQAKARLGAYESVLRIVRNEVLSARLLPAHSGIIRAQRNGGVDPELGLTDAQWRQHLAEAYAGNMQIKPGILGYRLTRIADGGRVLIEVDRRGANGAIRVVADAELPQRIDSDAFREVVDLTGDAVHFSQLRIVQGDDRDGGVSYPQISAAAPIRDADGAVFAVLSIELDLRPVFERIRDVLDNDTDVYFVEADGGYLMTYMAGRIVPAEPERRWQDDFPGLAAEIGDKPGTATVIPGRDGRRLAAAIVMAPLSSGVRTGVIETEPLERIMAPARALRTPGLIVGLAALLGAVLLAALLSRSLAKPIALLTRAVTAFSRTGRLVVPPGLQGESRILAGAFAETVARIDAANAALRSKSELLDKTIASMADAVAVLDAAGKRVFANPTCVALFGTAEEIGSERWKKKYKRFLADGVTPMPDYDSPAARARRGESFDNVELGIRHGDDPVVQLAASSRRIENPDGSFGGAVIVYRNVTAFKESERQLRQAQKMQAIGQLTGGVAHDLNNILTVITGGIEIIADGVVDRPELKDVAAMIDQAVTRASDLTHGLLSFSRKQPLQPRSIDVNALLLDTVKLLRPTLGAGIEIEVEPSPDLRPALADPSQLGSALINLAVNARDAMRGNGKLLLETGNVDLDQAYAEQHDEVAAGRYVMLAVSDNGCGIPASIRDRVFEPFFTTKAVGEGTGLGLSMVYGFIKQSGGHIELYSEEGHGTTIRLYLPCAAVGDGTLEPAAPPLAKGGRESVLVVEDDALVRSYVMTHLKALGYRAHSAASAGEAMSMVYDGVRFDLLFTDVMLPGGMNGPQLAEELRKYKPDLKVLFTSGYTETAMLRHGRIDAEVQLLPKPYRRADLARMLRLVLDTEAGVPAK
ncbi:multi-sensor hybrid histidine kinase [Rhodopseudomonas thermotolerans]|uniref:histidine kinase n=2 Tax=Rhodopseudomonas TaxID=1073 RepID=A0A336JQB1_9BRAD|nr:MULTISPECIES: ATP-binding protein [Rhodopseudomonas]RED38301.1 multi-sensor hybrid histidine kinase [Rhodopseudomonas pentothenatexigens]REG05886.1 multi-sensor hybrid histidine kinase [Rhodopseudomonas thermotolerans]SSW89754.1 multi-sensor hybrid histidine kinase [Rhodopseudomonas pentothenatexigens]